MYKCPVSSPHGHLRVGVETSLYQHCAIHTSLPARCRVFATDTTHLVEHVRPRLAGVRPNKDLECCWLVVTHQLMRQREKEFDLEKFHKNFLLSYTSKL